VKLLFDENLSDRLVEVLSVDFPESVHVRSIGLEAATDQVVWDYARANGLVIVSKDSDFHQMSFLFGAPPKVVWIRKGNCTTDQVGDLLRSEGKKLVAFEADIDASFLVLG
jgi:predicted nuclease of predicted toxin-antitoxin system